MAYTIGAYYKTGGAETGGANALTGLDSGATRLSVADGETSPLTIAALDTAYTLYYKSEDDATFIDPLKDTNASFTVTVPTDFLVSVDASTNWSATAVVTPAVGCFRPVYVKQTARVTSADQDVEMGTGGVTFSAGVRVAQVGTVTASAGSAAVTLSWTDLDMSANGRYEIHRATNSDFSANLVILTTTLADGSASYVNNSANGNAPVSGTLYYYRVRAVDARGLGAWSAAVSATPFTALWAGTSTIDTAAGITIGVQGLKMARSSTGVLWTSFSKTNTVSNIYVAYSTTGGQTWSTPEAVDPDTTNAQLYSSITVDNDGVVHVLYSENDANSDQMLKHAYGSSGSWTVEVAVASVTSVDLDTAKVLVDDSDNLHVAYRYNAAVNDIYYVKGAADGDGTWTWGSPEIVLGDASSDDFIYVDIALDDDGYPYIVGGETTGDDVWFSHKRGASWTAPAEISSDGRNNGPCSLYVTGSGTSAVVLIAIVNSAQGITIHKSTDGGANFTSTTKAEVASTGVTIVLGGTDTAYFTFTSMSTGTAEVYAYPYTISTGAFGTISTVTASSAAAVTLGQMLGQHLPSTFSRHQEASAGFATTCVITAATPVLKYFGSSGVTA